VLETIKEEHDKFMDPETRQVKWAAIKYKLDDFFKYLPIFEIPPMHFSELPEE
jgi:hypothetical protein